MEKKKFFLCLIGITIPLYIFCSSITAAKHEKDHRLSVLTRDAAQLMYLGVSIMGALGYSTNIQFYNGRITLDLITIAVLNDAACTYLVTTLIPYL
jgi:hypothetical protein